MVEHACHPSTGKAEAAGSQVQGQLGLHGKTVLRTTEKVRHISYTSNDTKIQRAKLMYGE
jgi:hypothetical protein